MIIRCWGARGSIPVSGKDYLKYGGDTTCIEIRTKKGDVVIIDSGTGIRRLGNHLLLENQLVNYLLFTHCHWDHILGFPYFKPIYRTDTRIHIYGCQFAQESVKTILSNTMSVPFFPVRLDDVRADIHYHGACQNPFSIGSLKITPIFLSHPNKGIGYKMVEDDKVFVFLTDNELSYKHPGGLDPQDYQAAVEDADLLVHDAEYSEEEYAFKKGWGHSSYTDALHLALDANVKQFGLFHHNQERTDEEVDAMVRDCKQIIEKRKSHIMCFGMSTDQVIRL